MAKKSKLWKTCEIVDIYFPSTIWSAAPPLPPDILVICLEFSGMVGNDFFWIYF